MLIEFIGAGTFVVVAEECLRVAHGNGGGRVEEDGEGGGGGGGGGHLSLFPLLPLWKSRQKGESPSASRMEPRAK
jgi:hypothetical protein